MLNVKDFRKARSADFSMAVNATGLRSKQYFGTDGIRGRANGVITPELALKVGQATATGS
jgi:phosphomannomutase